MDPRMVVLLFGPPGAGKTTAARASGLQVFDRDDPEWRGEAHFRQKIGELAHNPRARAVVIRAGASSSARRKSIEHTGATHAYLLVEDPKELAHRVRTRNRADKVVGLSSIKTWFESFDDYDGVKKFPGWEVVHGTATVGATSRAW